MPDLTAVGAVAAAFFAAVSSFLMMRVHRRNELESMRPELVLTGWSWDDVHPEGTTLRPWAVRNVGRGTAHAVNLHLAPEVVSQNWVVWDGSFLWVLAPGEEVRLESGIQILWNNMEPETDGRKSVFFEVNMVFSDRSERLYRTAYWVMAAEDRLPIGSDHVAPGVHVSFRRTVSRSRARHIVRGWLRKVPVFRGLLGDDLPL